MTIIEKYWAPRVKDSIKTIKSLRNGSGVAFDLRSDLAEGFMENYERLKEVNKNRVDFNVVRCTSKPDVESDNSGGYGG
jgi:hypothetical protein